MNAAVTDPALKPPSVDAALSTMVGDRQRDVAEAQRRQAELDKGRGAGDAALGEEISGLQSVADATKQLAATPPPTMQAPPEWKPKPIVDPNEFHGLSLGLIAMALIGGVVSKGNWMGVSSSLNGALQGYLDGNQAKADREYKDYTTKFNEALEHNKEQQREFESILNNKQSSINAMLAQVKVAAAKYQREDIRQAAEQKSIDGVWRQVEASDRSIAQIEEQRDRVSMQIQLGLTRLKQQSGGADKLDEYGQWFIDQTGTAGMVQFRKELESRYGGATAALEFNRIGKELRDRGLDPREVGEAQLDNMVQKGTQQQISNRTAGVERLTGSISQLETEINRLVAKVNGQGINAANKTLNGIAAQLGDQSIQRDISELKTLMAGFGRQYFEALTMPGSNAQMHASAQQVADALADPNANIATIQGVLKGANFEIKSTTTALHQQQEESRRRVTGQGPTLDLPGASPGATPPAGGGSASLSDEELLKKYAPTP